MATARQPPSAPAAAAHWVPLAAAVVFALLALDVVLHGPLSRLDPVVSDWSALHRDPRLTSLMLAVTALHSTLGIDLMAGLLVLALFAAGRRCQPLALLACVQGGMLLNVVVKLAIQRGRPEAQHALVHLGTYSFPSGHALAATVWWGTVLWLGWAHWRQASLRAVALAVAIVLVALVAASRVYLGAHYPTDVLAGCAEGVAWLGLWQWLSQSAAAGRFGGP
ncbi:MAG: phosphatase PAP2 family protein [Ramlibacter sp.]